MNERISVYVVCKNPKKAKKVACKISCGLRQRSGREKAFRADNSPYGESSSDDTIRLFTEAGKLRSMREIETEVILRALRLYSNDYTFTAKALGISRSTFYRRVEKLVSHD
jgi:transcriptional regulator with PAS, ATPase and Fis domain